MLPLVLADARACARSAATRARRSCFAASQCLLLMCSTAPCSCTQHATESWSHGLLVLRSPDPTSKPWQRWAQATGFRAVSHRATRQQRVLLGGLQLIRRRCAQPICTREPSTQPLQRSHVALSRLSRRSTAPLLPRTRLDAVHGGIYPSGQPCSRGSSGTSELTLDSHSSSSDQHSQHARRAYTVSGCLLADDGEQLRPRCCTVRCWRITTRLRRQGKTRCDQLKRRRLAGCVISSLKRRGDASVRSRSRAAVTMVCFRSGRA